MPTLAKPKPKRKAKTSVSNPKVTVEEILLAATRLRGEQFERLRKELESEQQWRASLARATKRSHARGLTDEQIDEIVMRSRREGRR